MTIAVADKQFRGPYSRLEMLEDRPGVWVVTDGRSMPPVAAGAAEDVRQAVTGHPARARWTRRCERPAVAVFYCPLEARRERLLRELRGRYELPCLADGVTLPAPRVAEDRVVAVAGGGTAEENGGRPSGADSRVA